MVIDFAERKNEPILLRRPVNLLGLIELAEFAGDAEVALALGEARGLGVLEEFEGGLEGTEKALLDEGAVEEGLGLKVTGFESVVGGGGFVAAEAVEAPLDFSKSADVVGFSFADR